MKMTAQPSKMTNATICCCRNDATSTSSSSSAGGDAEGGAAMGGTKRGRIVARHIPSLGAAGQN